MREGHLVTYEGVYVNKMEGKLSKGIKGRKIERPIQAEVRVYLENTFHHHAIFSQLHHVKQESVTGIDEGYEDPIVSF